MFDSTDELLAALPPDENDHWELKSADILKTTERNAFKLELSKQVSAFANSGGGKLVIGLSNTRQLEPCEQAVGRTPMKDWLSTMVEQSVEYPVRHFRVHRIPFPGDASNSVFLIEVDDSPAAPHQAVDKFYYYRIDGHSKPAPHFHIELLRNRITKSLLEVKDIELKTSGTQQGGVVSVKILLKVYVKNCSMQSATAWGVQLKMLGENEYWTTESNILLSTNCFHAVDPPVLLPNEIAFIPIRIKADMENERSPGYIFLLSQFCQGFTVTPLSQNSIGTERQFPDDFRDKAHAWLKNTCIDFGIYGGHMLKLIAEFRGK